MLILSPRLNFNTSNVKVQQVFKLFIKAFTLFQYIQCEGSAQKHYDLTIAYVNFNTSNVKVQHTLEEGQNKRKQTFQYIQCEGSAKEVIDYEYRGKLFQYIQCEGSANWY